MGDQVILLIPILKKNVRSRQDRRRSRCDRKQQQQQTTGDASDCTSLPLRYGLADLFPVNSRRKNVWLKEDGNSTTRPLNNAVE